MDKVIVKNYTKNPINIIAGIFAVIVSWYYNHSILWAIFHYIFGWIYILYCFLKGRFADGNLEEIFKSFI